MYRSSFAVSHRHDFLSRYDRCFVVASSFLVLFLLLRSVFSALSASVVAHLPGCQGPPSIWRQGWYVTVDEVNGAELFYYFTASEGDPSQDPLLLWLTGGDRCSVFSGLAK
ncbi:serine carboxypeptidase-like [Musa troglodytarum]|uniref:Serine carboxypeptidase-like n=1 Tax=Musa troglodytarum TaxID=320322 RepID=A0A9E7EHN8_9LILI|nr:serine carboxypeptidase-like [Musa troglodytarum]